MSYYLSLQLRMLTRHFKDAGFKPWLAYIIVTFGFAGLSYFLFSRFEFAVYAYVLFALTLIGKLSETKRTEFLQLCFGDVKLRLIRISENVICALPFLAFLLYKQLFLFVLLLLVLAMLLALVNFRTNLSFVMWTPFSKRPFEFSTGFRNTYYVYLAAYVLAGMAVYLPNFNLGAFAMLLVFATTLSYYTKPENEYFVWMYKLNPKQFLLSKIKTALLFSTVLALPIALLLGTFFPQNIGILLLFLLVGWGFLTCMIVSKYAAYPEEINIPQGILLAFCLWFPPMLLVLIPYLFKKSVVRLSPLLK